MKTKTLIISDELRVALRNYDEAKGSYQRLDLEIHERGVCGDLSLQASLNKDQLKKLVDFLKRSEHVLV